MRENLEIVVLAAGKGTRMYSDTPKVLHELGGRPLLGHALARAHDLQPKKVHVVYGHGGEQVRTHFAAEPINWVWQSELRGTGDALRRALPAIDPEQLVLVLYGDVPLIRVATLVALLDATPSRGIAILTIELADPQGYGRIVRDSRGQVQRIVEQKDATEQELKIREVNTGFVAARAGALQHWVEQLGNNNAQGEYYLTDIIGLAVRDGASIHTHRPQVAWEILGVNTKQELSFLERQYHNEQAQMLMQQGVTVRDPARLDVRGEVTAGRDVVLDVNVILEGKVILGDAVHIGPNNFIRDTSIGAGTVVLANCVIEEATLGGHCRVGPFARIRPGTKLADHSHVGNFVEIKNSEVGAGSKVNHLSYIGDTTIGRDVNVGAGTITCNYDGANKHRTVIGDRVFIGSDTQLVAPVSVGADATIGAGSTIVKDAPAGELTLSRAEQKTRPGWKRPVKVEKKGKSKEKS